MDVTNQIDKKNVPKHVAVIMDGNGRWASSKGKPRVFGHTNGVKAVRETTEIAAELGISYLTLYAFSTENWNRPKLEVNALMTLLITTIKKEIHTLNENNVRLNAIGDISLLPRKTHETLMGAIEETKNNDRMTLNLALNYSARWDILQATKKAITAVNKGDLSINDLNEDSYQQFLSTAGMPDPELMIRTSGEQRISNFLLWQLAYSELYFTDTFWPDFDKKAFLHAIHDYQQRERRFGKTSDQIKS